LLIFFGGGEVPQVEFETNGGRAAEEQLAPDSPLLKQTKIFRYLNNLSLRPNESPYDINDNGFARGIIPSSSHSIFGVSNRATSLLSTTVNPEADSFVYMEALLESLAVLGKLGSALDAIAQRLPAETFALFETTVDEVEERLEFVKRKSITPLNERLENPEGVFLLGNNGPPSAVQKTGMQNSFSKSSTLRLSALESLATRVDHEILKDFFWTLYSKLVAVAQGFRVVTEVVNRIGSVCFVSSYYLTRIDVFFQRRDYKDVSGTKPGTLFPLTEIWDQVQMEVSN
jgi:exocyst complex component 4